MISTAHKIVPTILRSRADNSGMEAWPQQTAYEVGKETKSTSFASQKPKMYSVASLLEQFISPFGSSHGCDLWFQICVSSSKLSWMTLF
jgi:hypothetical protein